MCPEFTDAIGGSILELNFFISSDDLFDNHHGKGAL